MRKVRWATEYLPEARSLVKEPQQKKGSWKQDKKQLHLELGTGKGGYSLQMAALHPADQFVAVERNESAAGIAAKKYDLANRDNLQLICGNAGQAADWFAPGEVDIIHLNFSDPWPKKRNAKRRLSAGTFLDLYRTILKPNGLVIQKTDNHQLFEYSVMQFLANGWKLEEISVDFRSEDHPEDAVSEYEAKFMEEGKPIYRAVWNANGNNHNAAAIQ